MRTILIVGTSFHTLRNYLLAHDYEYVTLRDIHLTKHPDKKLKRRVVCDFSSEKSMFEAVDIARNKYRIDGVIATYENYILPAAQIAEYLGLPGIPVSAAEACTDKFIMREKFAQAPIKVSPDYAIVNSQKGLEDFAAAHTFPLILKPANLAKSLLVSKAHDMEELLKNYRSTLLNLEKVYKRYAPNKQPKLIVEEFMEGSIHSVDAFVDADGTPHVLQEVVDYQTGYDIGYDDNFHYSRLIPSELSKKQIGSIIETGIVGCRALGMKSSPAHIEIILTKQGPMIVEIGARNGGYRERMHNLANGIDITGNALRLAMGEKPEIKSKKNDSCTVLELFPKTAGKFIGINQEAALKKLPSLVSYDIKQPLNTSIGKSSDGFKMTAIIMLHNSDRAQFKKDLDFVNKNVFVRTITTN